MSYSAWRQEVAAGRMADWNTETNGYDPAPEVARTRTSRVWDRALKSWVILHFPVPYDIGTPGSRYSRTKE